MIIKANNVVINAEQAKVRAFLADSNNMEHLLPLDKITDFTATKDQCSFKVQGGITISLVQDGDNGSNELYMKSGEKSPFPFKLTILMNDSGATTEGYIEFDGKVNAFLKMMVERPLTNLFNYMSAQLVAHFSE
jgi:carbon monoxide dehydrogenase subunit G